MEVETAVPEAEHHEVSSEYICLALCSVFHAAIHLLCPLHLKSISSICIVNVTAQTRVPPPHCPGKINITRGINHSEDSVIPYHFILLIFENQL